MRTKFTLAPTQQSCSRQQQWHEAVLVTSCWSCAQRRVHKVTLFFNAATYNKRRIRLSCHTNTVMWRTIGVVCSPR